MSLFPKSRFDKDTDTLYVTVRRGLAHRSRQLDEDIVVDLAKDGQPVAYEIQFAHNTLSSCFA